MGFSFSTWCSMDAIIRRKRTMINLHDPGSSNMPTLQKLFRHVARDDHSSVEICFTRYFQRNGFGWRYAKLILASA